MPIKTGMNSFLSKLQNNFGTEIGSRKAFNTIYENLYFLRFLPITFLIKALLPLGLRTGNLSQKWSKFLWYTVYSFWWITHKLQKVRPSFFQTSKFRWFLTFLQNSLLFIKKEENITLMNTIPYRFKRRLAQVSTQRKI